VADGGQCGICGAALSPGAVTCPRCGTATAPPGAWPSEAVPGYLVEPPPPPAPPPAPRSERDIRGLAVVAAIVSGIAVLAALVAFADDDDPPSAFDTTTSSILVVDPTSTTVTETTPRTEPARELVEVWSYDAGAITADGTAFDGERVYGATLAGRVFALDPTSGAELWSVELGREIRAAPAVSGGTVLVSGDDADLHGAVVALDAATGAVRWQAELGEAVTADRPVAVAGQRAFVGATDVVALDVSTGDELWRALTEPTDPAPASAPFTDGERVYVEIDGAPLGYAAFDPVSGAGLWRVQATDAITGLAATVDNVFVYQQQPGGSGNANLVALDSASGLPRWRASIAAPTIAPPTAVPGGLVVVTDQLAVSLRGDTGQQAWAVDTGLPYPGIGAGTERVYLNAGSLDALDATTGALVGRAIPTQLSVLPPSVAGSLVLFLDTGGVVHAYR
jgi:outer membrane protein assembly factor BamB